MSKITSGTDYDAIKLAHTAAVTKGDTILASGRVLVALSTALINADAVYAIEAMIEAPKAVGAIAAGATVYWDNTAKNFTATVGTNTKAGYALEAALSADTVVQMKLTNDANL